MVVASTTPFRAGRLVSLLWRADGAISVACATRIGWSEGSGHAIVREILFVVQRVRIPPDQSPARQVGSEPCDGTGNKAGDA